MVHDHFIELFEKLRREQVIKDVPPQLALALITGAFGGVAKAFQAGELERTSEAEAVAEELCWEAIRR